MRQDRSMWAGDAQRITNQRRPRHEWLIPNRPHGEWRRVTARVRWEADGVEYVQASAKRWVPHGEWGWLIWVEFPDRRLHGGGVWLRRHDVRER